MCLNSYRGILLFSLHSNVFLVKLYGWDDYRYKFIEYRTIDKPLTHI